MIYLIFYDITTDSIRTKIAKTLIEGGYERLQFSVFTGLEAPYENENYWKKLQNILSDEKEAKFYVIPISKKNFRKLKKIGIFELDMDYLTGDKRSLTF